MSGIQEFLRHIESVKLRRSFFTLLAWVFLRIFFEGIFELPHRIGYIPFSYKALVVYFIHYPSFYLSLFLIAAIITALITHEQIQKITGAFAYGYGIVLFVPLIDWIIGGGYSITYPLRIGPYLISSLNPFTSIIEYGGSPGQRIIFFVICLLIAFYAFLKTKKILISILLFVILYFTIILLGGLPTLIAGNRPENLYITGGILYSDTQKFASIFVLLLVFATIFYLYLVNKGSFKLLIPSIRPERAVFYSSVGVCGLLLSLHQTSVSVQNRFPFIFDRIGIAILWLSLAFGYQGAAAINDFFDEESDTLTRLRNPLVKGINRNYYLAWTMIFTGFAIILSMLINYVCFLLMLSLIVLSILYSMPPVKLKRIPLISSFVLAVATVMSMAMGYSIVSGGNVFSQMPGSILKATLIAITLGFVAKDIEDITGDIKSNVLTLPIIFSTKNQQMLRLPIAIIIGSSYLFFALFIKQLFIGSLIFAIATILYIMLAKKLHEWTYFVLLYLYGAYLVYMLGRLPVLP